jgi:pimeloyl-ACP methyl ester carboxylesterase
MVPKKATDKLIKHLGDPEVAVIRESGHILPQEAPNRCRTLLKDFIFKNNPTT